MSVVFLDRKKIVLFSITISCSDEPYKGIYQREIFRTVKRIVTILKKFPESTCHKQDNSPGESSLDRLPLKERISPGVPVVGWQDEEHKDHEDGGGGRSDVDGFTCKNEEIPMLKY